MLSDTLFRIVNIGWKLGVDDGLRRREVLERKSARATAAEIRRRVEDAAMQGHKGDQVERVARRARGSAEPGGCAPAAEAAG